MRYRITDSQMAGEELILDLDQDEAEDPNEPEVNEEHAQEVIDWWIDFPGRNGEIIPDSGYIVMVSSEADAGPMIGNWYTEMHDLQWPLSNFPFTSLSYERIDDEPEVTIVSSGILTKDGYTELPDEGDGE